MRLRVGIHGFGVVGRGVARALALTRWPFKPEVHFVLDSRGGVFDPHGLDLEKTRVAKESVGLERGPGQYKRTDCVQALRANEIDVLVECTPTDLDDGGAGMRAVREALSRGVSVITANKGPLALAYPELVAAANKQRTHLLFSATVGGAVPVIETARDALRACDVTKIEGILNGCTNFILSRMEETSRPYFDILDEAKQMGIAETDPRFDVEGWDTASKLVILSNVVFRRHINVKEIPRRGIEKVTPDDVAHANSRGKRVKLVGLLSRDRAEVAPRLIDIDSLLDVGGTRNIAVYSTDLAGEIAISGRGAGQMETASAIMSDFLALYDRLTEEESMKKRYGGGGNQVVKKTRPARSAKGSR
ncbi:MAG TPA: homoserine dehydrogenase, partial [Thermoplasmata archaeon]|nr:homoserine dehydrogenase [Thermoplasmata archaeon]